MISSSFCNYILYDNEYASKQSNLGHLREIIFFLVISFCLHRYTTEFWFP